jgi:hypothetical protein
MAIDIHEPLEEEHSSFLHGFAFLLCLSAVIRIRRLALSKA